MQESADNVSPESSSPSKDDLLDEACKKYEEATRLCPTLNDVRVTATLFFYPVYSNLWLFWINEKQYLVDTFDSQDKSFFITD